MKLSDFKGKAVIVNFWSSWCGPCRQEMPDLDAAYQTYGKDGLVVLAVNLSESNLTVQHYLQDVTVHFPVVIDEKNRIEDLYHIIPLPTTFFVDRSGRIVGKREGQMTSAFIDQQVHTLLGQ